VRQIGFTLFIAAWVAGVASWLLALREFIGMWRFWPRVFGTGIRVLQETRSLPLPTLTVGSEFETKSGKFKIIAPQLCFFRRRMRWLDFDVHTPFPIKGSLRWNGSRAAIEGRIPVFTTLFFAAWLVGWTIGTAIAAFEPGQLVGGGAFLFLGWAFAAGMCLLSIPFEIRRAKRILREFEAQVAGPA
jgi:hypothetical protein